MPQRDDDIYVSAPLRRLLDAQTRVLAPVLQRCSGVHALLLSASSEDVPPALPLLGSWITLHQINGCYRGDLQAAADEPLPFVDDAFELVLLRHVLEVNQAAPELLDEAIRILAPGGVLVLTGIHPLGGWLPWFCWRKHGKKSLQLPLQLAQRLRRSGLDLELMQRTGGAWPGATAMRSPAASMFGGGYVIVVRKRRRMAIPLRMAPVPRVRAPARGQWSPGTRRSSTL